MPSDIEIIVGARDDATRILQHVAKQTQSMGNVVNGVTDRLTSSALKLAAGWFSLRAAAAVFKSTRDFLLLGADEFDKAVEAEKALATAIELSGVASSTAMPKHVALAESLEKQMNIEAEVVLGLMKQASMMGVAEDQLDNVTKAAIGLGQAMGIGLEGGLEKVRLATEGNFKSFEKLFPKIKEMATNEEKLEAVLSLAERGLIAQSAAADTATGSTQRATIAWGNMQEAAGGALSGLRELRNDGVVSLANAINTVLVPAVDAFTVSLGDLGQISDGMQTFFKQVIIGATFIETTLSNTSAIWTTTLASMELALVGFANDVSFYLTEQIPANFKNMVDGFKAMANDAAGFLKSTVTGEAFTPTAQNVGSSALPPRQPTQREAELITKIAKGEMAFIGDFMGKSISRILEFERLSVANANQLKNNLRVGNLIPVEDKDDDDEKAKKARRAGVPSLQATESRLLTRGQSIDPMLTVQREIKAKIQEQVEVSRDIHVAIKTGKAIKVEVVK